MSVEPFVARRLGNQRIAGDRAASPAEVVRWMGALQAQDYSAALWAVGLRTRSSTAAEVESAIGGGSILRTWPMRGTLHLVPAEDARWMVELLAPPVVRGAAARARQLELEDGDIATARRLVVGALEGGRRLTRPRAYALFDAGGISPAGQRGMHILWRLAQEAIICVGPREGAQPTYVLLEEWAPDSRRMQREEGLAELALRYFRSHGPATAEDFAWWAGLRVTEARATAAAAAAQLDCERRNGRAYYQGAGVPPEDAGGPFLLPAFDEYLLGYGDRSLVLAPEHARHVVPGGNGVFQPLVVRDGRVEGTWKRVQSRSTGSLAVAVLPLGTAPAPSEVDAALARYAAFMAREVTVAVPPVSRGERAANRL